MKTEYQFVPNERLIKHNREMRAREKISGPWFRPPGGTKSDGETDWDNEVWSLGAQPVVFASSFVLYKTFLLYKGGWKSLQCYSRERARGPWVFSQDCRGLRNGLERRNKEKGFFLPILYILSVPEKSLWEHREQCFARRVFSSLIRFLPLYCVLSCHPGWRHFCIPCEPKKNLYPSTGVYERQRKNS